ncbi:MAG: hypothetical protein FWD99_08865 [Oscillospiraceae bacterium]|nr:hypothetical protein [Oscillospiraceae bacterium]
MRLKERIKTILIVLLSISAVALGIGTGLFDGAIRSVGLYVTIEEMFLPESAPQRAIAPAAWPTAALATLGPDTAYGHRWDRQEESVGVRTLYGLFSGILGEAFGSSGPPTAVSRSDWETALSNLGVFFRYDLEIPGDVLARWFGTEPGGVVAPVQMLYLAPGPDRVELYFMGEDNRPYRAATAVRSEDVLEVLHNLTPNGVGFGFQSAADQALDPDTILLPNYGQIPTILEHSAMGSVYGNLDEILARLHINAALARSMDEGGTRIFVEEGATLRISEDGVIHYQYQGESPRIATGEMVPDLWEAIEAARQITESLTLVSGAADIYLTGFDYSDDLFIIRFGYYIGGLPIWTDSPAAQVTFTGRYVTDVLFLARAYYRTGQFSAVLPELQATAAAGDAPLRLAFAPVDAAGGDSERAGTELRVRWILGPVREGELHG